MLTAHYLLIEGCISTEDSMTVRSIVSEIPTGERAEPENNMRHCRIRIVQKQGVTYRDEK